MSQAIQGIGESNSGEFIAEAQSGRVTWSAITLEHALYSAIFAAGVAVRFWGLARMPLDSLEAVNSLAAWQWAMASSAPIDLAPASPLLLHLQGLLFWLGANGDVAARVVSAAAGSLLVLVPWLMRGLLGRSAALWLALLFALDPWLVGFSRLADGAVLSALLALLLLALLASLSLSSFRESTAAMPGRRRRDSILIAVVAGLYVTSGPMAWSLLPVLAAFAAWNFAHLRREAIVDVTVGAWFVGALLVGATGWLTAPGHVGLISASLTAWVDAALTAAMPPLAGSGGVMYGAAWPVRTLLADQPFVTLFGIAGLAHMAWRGRSGASAEVRWTETLWFWLAWGIVVNLLPGRSPFTLLVVALPLLFGASYLLARLTAAVPMGERTRETAAVVGTLLLLLFSAALWGASMVASPTLDSLALQALLLLLLLAAAILVFFGIWSGWQEAVWAGAVAFGLVLMAVNVGATWRVNHWYDLGRPSGLFAEASDLGIRQLAADVEKLSAQRAGDAHELPVVIEGAAYSRMGAGESSGDHLQALLGWHLREMRNLQWGGADAFAGARQPLVIAGAVADGVPALLNGADYVGSEYEMSSYASPTAPIAEEGAVGEAPTAVQAVRQRIDRGWTERVQPWLRWALYRKGPPPAATETVTLWAPRSE